MAAQSSVRPPRRTRWWFDVSAVAAAATVLVLILVGTAPRIPW